MLNLHKLFLVHAAITFAAAIVLVFMPTVIPGIMDVKLDRTAYLLSYFLGSAELALAYLSFFARKIIDDQALRIIVWTFIVFHLATALAEIYSYFLSGINFKIWLNVGLRILFVILFANFGLHKRFTK